MFKTLIFFIILALICVVIWSVSKIFYLKKYDNSVSIESIDILISTLKNKIDEYKNKTELGIENSKTTLERFERELEKAEKLKEKIKSI